MMHDLYRSLTGYEVTLDAAREWAWYEWHRRGLGPDDLRALVAWRKSRIRAGELPATALTFRRLVGQADYAEEDIMLLRAKRARQTATESRPARPRRQPEPAPDPETRQRLAEQLRKLREEL
jgi:hypothetical protein